MRWIVSIVTVIVTAAALGGAVLLGWGYQQYQKPLSLPAPVLFVVERGDGAAVIANHMAEKKIISYPLLLRVAARVKGIETDLHAGEYQIVPAMNMDDLLAMMAAGKVYQRQFTVPEGLTSWQVVNLLQDVDMLAGALENIPAEGSLLPETYNFVRGETRQQKITQMQKAMTATLDELWGRRSENLPVKTKEEALVLASIVEKETGVASERRRVAGVFINRLRKGMLLQTDPTVIYALTDGKIEEKGQGPLGRRLLSKDLQFDSPYNTYRYAGLPPGPIANPGRDSIAAVLNPEDHDYLYFVADGTGGHAFAKTLDEHNRNVAKWRKLRKSKSQSQQ